MNTYVQSELFTLEELMKVFVISDHHFNHKNIIKYCNRPFKTLKEMNIIMANRWNSIVKSNDIVLHLGDFSFGSKKMVWDRRKKLRGKIYMIKGNHDKHGIKWYDDINITMIKKSFMVGNILFSHRPQQDIRRNMINICGHSHNKKPFLTEERERKWFNVSVDNMDYTPVLIGDLLNGSF